MPKPRNRPNIIQTSTRTKLDAQAFEEIQRRSAEKLKAVLLGIVRDPDRAEDIGARAFAIAWEKRDQFRGEASPDTWIQTIARREAFDEIYKQKNIQNLSIDSTGSLELGEADVVSDQVERKEEIDRLKAALGRLPKRHRSILIAQVFEGLSIREIAELQKMPPGTVLSRLHTAKELLRHAWNQVDLDHPRNEAVVKGDHAESEKQQSNEVETDQLWASSRREWSR